MAETKSKARGIDEILAEITELDNRKEELVGELRSYYDKLSSFFPSHSQPARAQRTAPAKKTGVPEKPEGPGPVNGEWKYCPTHGWGDHDARKHRSENMAKKAQA